MIQYEYHGSRATKEHEFWISYDGTIDAGDYDIECSLLRAELGEKLDERGQFILAFVDGGYRKILETGFSRPFMTAIFEQGIEAFSGGPGVMTRDDEFDLLVRFLEIALWQEDFSEVTASVCHRIRKLATPKDRIYIDITSDTEVYSEDICETIAIIKYSLWINDLEIKTAWESRAKKWICDPLTLEICFEDSEEVLEEIPSEAFDICEALGIEFPKGPVDKKLVEDPYVPRENRYGRYVLLYTLTDDPVSPSSAQAIKRYDNMFDVIRTVDISTNVLYHNEESDKYKMTVAEVQIMSLEEARERQKKLFSEKEMGKEPSLSPLGLLPIYTWLCREDQYGCAWVRINHLQDDEIDTDGVFEE